MATHLASHMDVHSCTVRAVTPRNLVKDLERWLTPDPEQGNTTAAYRWRVATGISRVALARRLEVGYNTLVRWERGDGWPRNVRDRVMYARYLKSIQPKEES